MPLTAIAYDGPDGPSLAIFPKERGGLRTAHTPDGVAYYLDQASRSESVGARSAAMSMYRAALDQLLFEQGFTEGMTGQKVEDLRLAIDVAKGSTSMPVKRKTPLPAAPAWALDLETEFLELLTQLGSGAIRPNDGDVEKQAILDATLL